MRTLAAIVLAASLFLFRCDDNGSTTGGDGAASDGQSAGDGGKGGDGSKGTGKVGDPCKEDSDCAEPPDAECFTTVGGGLAPTLVFPGGYCSRPCGQEDSGPPDCGKGGACAQLSMGKARFQFCGKTCKKNEDCRTAEGYSCHIIFPGFPGVCAP